MQSNIIEFVTALQRVSTAQQIEPAL